MLPLAGLLVLDASRMLPGAVLARSLLERGARVIKVEHPRGGDPLRRVPPLVDGMGAGFRAYYGGAESLALDLASPAGAAGLAGLAQHADVLVESFRPGTMERWGLGAARLISLQPRLVVCSLPAHGVGDPRLAHDLNVIAESGLLAMLPGGGIPRVQIADVTTGLLAANAVLAALLVRARTGRGAHVEQPLAAAAAPFLHWAMADAAAGGGGAATGLLSGAAPCYRVYRCADGEVALAALEPKFWLATLAMLGLSPDEHAASAFDAGARGAAAAAALARRFAERPRDHWVARATELAIPLSAARSLDEARRVADARRESGADAAAAGDARAAPPLGADGARILEEFGVASPAGEGDGA